jgi:hypothetical protein
VFKGKGASRENTPSEGSRYSRLSSASKTTRARRRSTDIDKVNTLTSKTEKLEYFIQSSKLLIVGVATSCHVAPPTSTTR